jgi:hypothetical protein
MAPPLGAALGHPLFIESRFLRFEDSRGAG